MIKKCWLKYKMMLGELKKSNDEKNEYLVDKSDYEKQWTSVKISDNWSTKLWG